MLEPSPAARDGSFLLMLLMLFFMILAAAFSQA
ncbi:hypothetical protein B14911_14807 [Bacillus sp. NRRL B-14911]|nr:hypothetical protein B14911_14807 [Bacillus sp. NRRL B-14911]